MNQPTRRQFLQSSTVLVAAAFTGSAFDFEKRTPLLSFSTLGCPDWSFQQILNFASENSYKGIELRGILRELDLPKCKEFNSSQSRSHSLRMMEEKGLRFVNLGSSATLHFNDSTKRQKNIDEGKRFIDLAQDIKCPYVRVFPNNFPKDQEKDTTMDLIAKGLMELGDHAKGSGVVVLMETHGDLVYTADLEKIMQSAQHSQVGLIWDITNMWTVTKEDPVQVYDKLKKYIFHTHIKDAKLDGGKIQYTLLGQGEVPIFEAIDVLAKKGYKGYYSFEWEKLWHPEIADPTIALADYPLVMKRHFK